MAEITAGMVKELRERTGAGMLDCKNALTEAGGDFEAAVVLLRKKFGSKASDRAGRTAGEGVIAVAVVDERDAAIIELNSETDFVARNDDFKALARELAEHVARAKHHSVEVVLTQQSHAVPGMTVKERINDVFTKLRENIVFRRVEFISTDASGALSSYVHIPANDKIGVLVELEAKSPDAAGSDAVRALGRELAMQIAALRPKFTTRDEVSADVLDRERDIARTQAVNEGKPEAAIEKIVEGRVGRFYEESVLMDQVWLRDNKKKVAQVLADAGVALRRYVRFEVGEQTAQAA